MKFLIIMIISSFLLTSCGSKKTEREASSEAGKVEEVKKEETIVAKKLLELQDEKEIDLDRFSYLIEPVDRVKTHIGIQSLQKCLYMRLCNGEKDCQANRACTVKTESQTTLIEREESYTVQYHKDTIKGFSTECSQEDVEQFSKDMVLIGGATFQKISKGSDNEYQYLKRYNEDNPNLLTMMKEQTFFYKGFKGNQDFVRMEALYQVTEKPEILVAGNVYYSLDPYSIGKAYYSINYQNEFSYECEHSPFEEVDVNSLDTSKLDKVNFPVEEPIHNID